MTASTAYCLPNNGSSTIVQCPCQPSDKSCIVIFLHYFFFVHCSPHSLLSSNKEVLSQGTPPLRSFPYTKGYWSRRQKMQVWACRIVTTQLFDRWIVWYSTREHKPQSRLRVNGGGPMTACRQRTCLCYTMLPTMNPRSSAIDLSSFCRQLVTASRMNAVIRLLGFSSFM